ncbi:SAC3/GANP/Nin1/mts3/eIF-3 p25 family-domain-containing protein [Mycena leptocephala]|nr:SAC3/GANP/Nin1/mts3/eIF-3 p25 family-domain-containing protein [Mycena leptocephala]
MFPKARYADLRASFTAVPPDLTQCGRLLTQLKVDLLQAGLLIPHEHMNMDDLVVAREILEIGAFWSIRSQDLVSFDHYLSQLQTFYNDFTCVPCATSNNMFIDFRSSTLPPSQYEYPIRGLQLVRLLTQNLIGDFHTALEGLHDMAMKSPYIMYPINLERWLMEGSYAKVWGTCTQVPAPEYSYFVDSLMDITRNEIARCQEAAYESLTLEDAATLLFFPSQPELLAFARERQWNLNMTLGEVTFTKCGEEATYITKDKIIATSLLFARELEQIV